MPKRKISTQSPCFAKNLKRIRKQADVTQEYVAEQLNINRATYTKWETGVSEPSFCCLARLLIIFNKIGHMNLDYNDLLQEKGKAGENHEKQ